jgi:hypothetical protein
MAASMSAYPKPRFSLDVCHLCFVTFPQGETAFRQSDCQLDRCPGRMVIVRNVEELRAVRRTGQPDTLRPLRRRGRRFAKKLTAYLRKAPIWKFSVVERKLPTLFGLKQVQGSPGEPKRRRRLTVAGLKIARSQPGSSQGAKCRMKKPTLPGTARVAMPTLAKRVMPQTKAMPPTRPDNARLHTARGYFPGCSPDQLARRK